MRIRIGYELRYNCAQPTPMIAMLHVHHSRTADLEAPDNMTTYPAVPLDGYRDGFGNWCTRLVVPPGEFVMTADTVIHDSGEPDPYAPDAVQHPVEELPSEVLEYLLGSRYCETDKLSNEAWRLFGHTPLGWARVQAVCDFVHDHIVFSYANARSTRTAADAYEERSGVCRDFAHLAVTFCRCLNIPARYCTGYVSDIGQPPPYPAMDFAAYIEVFLGNQWWVFDPRNNDIRRGRILIARGRDATDVPITHTFGYNALTGFTVYTDELPG